MALAWNQKLSRLFAFLKRFYFCGLFHFLGYLVGFYDSLYVLNTVLYIISPNVTTEGDSIHGFYIPTLTRTFIFVLRIFIFT